MKEIAKRLHERRQVEKAKELLESAGYKVEKSLTESVDLREFTREDYYGFAGVDEFADGSRPLIAESEYATLIVGGDYDNKGGAKIYIIYGDNEDYEDEDYTENSSEMQKNYNSKEEALEDVDFFLKLIDKEINEAQLKRLGFISIL